MIIFFKKYSTILLISLLAVVLVLAWLFPSSGLVPEIAFLLFSFAISGAIILEKHKELYRQGKVTRSVFIRNTALEIAGTWLAIILAGLLGRYIAEMATSQFNGALLKSIAGIAIGLLVGIAVGIFTSRAWSRFMKMSS